MCHTNGTSSLWGGGAIEGIRRLGKRGETRGWCEWWGESTREGREGLLLKDSFQNILFNPP